MRYILVSSLCFFKCFKVCRYVEEAAADDSEAAIFNDAESVTFPPSVRM
jgi:hypothetical protein